MTPTDWIQAISMVVLVVVTGIYVWRTHVISKATKQQAEASVKMAEEMREQRYDSVRPVIDIQDQELGAMELGRIGYGGLLSKLPCVLHNIGLGPAIDVYSFIEGSSDECQQFDFGTLATGGKTSKPMNLSLKHKGNPMVLVACYKDVYGRTFKSSRKVESALKIGPLQVQLAEEEH